MRNILFLFVAISVLTSLPSCKQKEEDKTAVDLLKNEVMAIHDEVMPLMDDMARNEKELRKFLKKEVSISDTLQNQIRTNLTNLDNTADAMMQWMSDWKAPDGKNEEEAMKYLNDQKVKIMKVSKGMKMAYEKSSVLLQNLNEKQNQ